MIPQLKFSNSNVSFKASNDSILSSINANFINSQMQKNTSNVSSAPKASQQAYQTHETFTSQNVSQPTASQPTADVQNEPEIKNTKSFFLKAKKSVTNVIKGANNVTSISKGAIQGTLEGAVLASIIAVVSKNYIKGNGKILETLKAFGEDIKTMFKAIPGAIKKAYVNSPKDNLSDIFKSAKSAPRKIYNAAKAHKKIAAVASGVMALMIAFRTIQGKMHANKRNAEIDHNTNQGHVK